MNWWDDDRPGGRRGGAPGGGRGWAKRDARGRGAAREGVARNAPTDERQNHKRGDILWSDDTPLKRTFASLAFLLAFSLTQLAGYSLTELIFRFTGRPPDALAHILSALLGVLLLGAGVGLMNLFSWRDRQRVRDSITSRLTDALAQIAQGNFNVLIDTRDAYVHPELATAINDMARNLGALETMRQDFISNVSHEIQSPLTSIAGFAELLQNPNLPADEQLRYAQIIRAESKRLSNLSDNLLRLSSLDNDPLSKTAFRLDRQLSNVILTLEPQWSAKNILLEADLPKHAVCADEGLLSQVWINLLHNAIKFTPEGGTVIVKLESDEGEGGGSGGGGGGGEDGGGTTVTIADTGVGIAKDDLPHIFERFYKADKARDRALGGNGLGLSLVKKIVELHDGHLSVESAPTKGTTFKISLPGLHSA